MAKKESLLLAENLEVVDVLLGKKSQRRNSELLIMIRISLMRLQKSLVYHQKYIQENAELSPKRGLFAYAFAGRDITGKSIEDMVYEAQRKVILELAEKGILCDHRKKCGFYLKNQDDVLNVFIHEDMPEKDTAYLQTYTMSQKLIFQNDNRNR